jgi:arsenite methyltransferase
MEKGAKGIREAVNERYGRLARDGWEQGSVSESDIISIYSLNDLKGIPEESVGSACACGNPTALAELEPGEVVLDLGSGAGVDAFLAARRVGPAGMVIGVDASDEMLEKAARSAMNMGLENVEFRKGQIESLPVESGTVDVIISNCVINLSTDKDAVFSEAYRVLRPGGRFCVSDRVMIKPLDEEAKRNLTLWSACVSGALLEEDFLDRLRRAGFRDIEVVDRHTFTEQEAKLMAASISRSMRERGEEFDDMVARRAYSVIASDRITARKPL